MENKKPVLSLEEATANVKNALLAYGNQEMLEKFSAIEESVKELNKEKQK